MAPTMRGAREHEGPLPWAPPVQDCAVVAEWILDDVAQLSALRTGLAREIGATWSAGVDSPAEKMVLVASELATNAIQHGLPPTVVRLLMSADSWLLDVADHDPGSAPNVDDRLPGEGGLGLQIAQRLSLEVGWYATGTAKHVWAVLPRAAPGDEDLAQGA